jgi:hypothetical protein
MAIEIRDTFQARLRRWGGLAAGAVAVLLSLWWTVGHYSEAGRVADDISRVESDLLEHIEAADAVAEDCGLAPFSDEASLAHFPMKVPDFPTRKERECGRTVGIARADLQDDHILLADLRPRLAASSDSAGSYLTSSIVLLVGWLIAFAILEIFPRKPLRRRN